MCETCDAKKVPGTDGDKYIPYEERTGETSTVYFTRDLSAEGLKKIYEKIQENSTDQTSSRVHGYRN